MNKSNISPRTQAKTIADAAAFDMKKVVKRYIQDHDVPESEALRHEDELKRYLTLCALHPYANYGMRGPIDHLWHTFIFFTKDYFAFCDLVAGRYIHHVPEDADDRRWEGSKSTYPKMLKAYKLVFGTEPPMDIWPVFKKSAKASPNDADSCSSHCSGSCDSCGSGCTSCNGGCSGCNHCGPSE